MNVSRIRGFLLKQPKPAELRLTIDGEHESVKPGKSWAKTAETVVALAPDLIECLDASGGIIRAMRTDTAEARRSDAAEPPAVIADDPQAALLTHFANLLHRAYEHSTETAFAKMVELVEKMGDRSDSIEARLERSEAHNRRLQSEQIEDAYAHAAELASQAAAQNGEGGDLLQNLAGAFLSGQQLRKTHGTKPTNGQG